MNKLPLKVYLALATVILLWASAFVGIRIALRGYSPGAMALLRYGVASFAMLFLYFSRRHRQKIALRDLPGLCAIGILGFAVYNVALNYGELSVPAGIASFIISLSPIVTMIIAIFYLKEKVNWVGWLGVSISFLGVGIIAWGEHDGVHFDYGVLTTLVAMIACSVYVVLQKPMLEKFHPIELTALAIWIGTAAMLGFLPQLIHQIPLASWKVTATVIYLGLFPAAIAYALWTYALSFMSASKTIRYMYTLPLVTTLMGWLLIDEIPALLSLIGGIIALVGAVIANQVRFKKVAFMKNQRPTL